jgi:hypothetical protein
VMVRSRMLILKAAFRDGALVPRDPGAAHDLSAAAPPRWCRSLACARARPAL